MNCEHVTIKHSIKCYDNGGRTADRYTVLYLNRRTGENPRRGPCMGVTMSASPFHPQGICQHGEDFIRNSRLGKVIRFRDLPRDCRTVVLKDLN